MKLLLVFCGILFALNLFSQEKDKPFECILTISQPAQFPGGNEAMQKFLHEFICYPQQGVKDSIQGKVVVEFMVDTSGNVLNPKIKRSLRKDFDEICLGVFEFMPKWIPAMDNGKKVKQKFILPFSFQLNDNGTSAFTPISCDALELKKQKIRNEQHH